MSSWEMMSLRISSVSVAVAAKTGTPGGAKVRTDGHSLAVNVHSSKEFDALCNIRGGGGGY